ncbi:MAG: hypothetical protein CFE24_06670 [Flavobacterium sp. BFFFF2]|nr:MAG: hypothetical protein CFE24_06670 [Flavobacterium sp. BFFFF2]
MQKSDNLEQKSSFFASIKKVQTTSFRSAAMQCKKVKIWNKNPHFSLQSKKFKPVQLKKAKKKAKLHD